MSNNRIVFGGMDEFKAALRNLPAHLTQEATGIVNGHADAAAAKIIEAYPTGPTGDLKAGVRVEHLSASAGGVIARVRNSAFLAYIYENGSQARHTAIGANRGAMPPGNVFIPIAIRERRAMVDDLIAMVRREGLVVTGG